VPEENSRQNSNSGHKRAKTHLNFYPQQMNSETSHSRIEVPAIIDKVPKFDIEKENFVTSGN